MPRSFGACHVRTVMQKLHEKGYKALFCGRLLSPTLDVSEWEAQRPLWWQLLMAWAVVLGSLPDPHMSFWGFLQLFAITVKVIDPFQLVWSVWFLVMTTVSWLHLCCTGNDEGLVYWSGIDQPDQRALLFHFMCFFFFSSWVGPTKGPCLKTFQGCIDPNFLSTSTQPHWGRRSNAPIVLVTHYKIKNCLQCDFCSTQSIS